MAEPTFTKTSHKRSYPAISPTRPELSCKDKTVIVTGAGQNIGAATALSFAKAGAVKIGLIGRTEKKLTDTKTKIESAHPDVRVCVAVADVSNAESLGMAAHDVRASLGAWDIFVHCAGVLGETLPMRAVDIDDWWSVFEVNTKSIAIFAKHFLTKCRLPGATFIYCNSAVAHLPVEVMPPCSAYSASKAAATKLIEWLAKENPGLRVFDVHPGFVKSPMSDGYLQPSGITLAPEHYDDADLAADFFVWCSSSEADFLKGRFVWATWDVEELAERKEELEKESGLLRMSLLGFPRV